MHTHDAHTRHDDTTHDASRNACTHDTASRVHVATGSTTHTTHDATHDATRPEDSNMPHARRHTCNGSRCPTCTTTHYVVRSGDVVNDDAHALRFAWTNERERTQELLEAIADRMPDATREAITGPIVIRNGTTLPLLFRDPDDTSVAEINLAIDTIRIRERFTREAIMDDGTTRTICEVCSEGIDDGCDCECNECGCVVHDDECAIRCADCNAPVCNDCHDSEWTNGDGDAVCASCADEYVTCEDCGERMHNESDDARCNDSGEWYCDSCFWDRHTTCDGCNDVIARDDAHTCNRCGETFCDGCNGDCDCRPYGCDVECVSWHPGDATDVARIPDDATVGIEIECEARAYPDTWEICEDGSLHNSDEWEIVSPVLHGTRGLAHAFGAIEAIQDDCEPCDSGGVHVHVGARSLSLREFHNVVSNWIAWGEDAFAGLIPGRRFRGTWCRSLRDNGYGSDILARARRAIRAHGDDARATSHAWDLSNGERYLALNPAAIGKHGTIEFRLFPSCVEPETVTRWAATCARFVDVARNLDPVRAGYLATQYGSFRFALRVLGQNDARHVEWMECTRDELERDGEGSRAHGAFRDPYGRNAKARRDAAKETGARVVHGWRNVRERATRNGITRQEYESARAHVNACTSCRDGCARCDRMRSIVREFESATEIDDVSPCVLVMRDGSHVVI